ncbi:hypothetical protein VCV18_004325 [Metarhizium anisopliae]
MPVEINVCTACELSRLKAAKKHAKASIASYKSQRRQLVSWPPHEIQLHKPDPAIAFHRFALDHQRTVSDQQQSELSINGQAAQIIRRHVPLALDIETGRPRSIEPVMLQYLAIHEPIAIDIECRLGILRAGIAQRTPLESGVTHRHQILRQVDICCADCAEVGNVRPRRIRARSHHISPQAPERRSLLDTG